MVDTEIDIEKFIQAYVNGCLKHAESTDEGNSRKANTAYKKVTELVKRIQDNDELTRTIFIRLLRCDDVRISYVAAGHCLGLNIFTEEAVELLERVRDMKELGLIAFDAKMTLKVWREQGYLTF